MRRALAILAIMSLGGFFLNSGALLAADPLQVAAEKACKDKKGSAKDKCIKDYKKAHPPKAASPAKDATCPASGCLPKASELGIPVLDSSGKDEIGSGINSIVKILGIIAGVVSVIFIVIGGINYATSGGDAQKVAGAKNTLLYAVIGLIISIIAPLVVGFVITKT